MARRKKQKNNLKFLKKIFEGRKIVLYVFLQIVLGISLIGKVARVGVTGALHRIKAVKIKVSLPKKVSVQIFPEVSLKSVLKEIYLRWPRVKFTIYNLQFTRPRFKVFKITKPKINFELPKLPTLNFKFTKKHFAGLWIATFLLLGFLFWWGILRDLPSPRELTSRKIDVSTKIYDRNGKLLYKIYKDENRTPVKLADVPQNVRLATLGAEDAEFYQHSGFSLRGIIRSIYKNATQGQLTGGSTITQQLVKNALLSPEKKITRKIKEIILSIEVELTYNKDAILEMYLNEVSYGGSAYGIQEASEVYFGKEVGKLTLPEAALLAGLPKSPTRFSPFGSSPELAIVRQGEVLHLMAVNKFITPSEEEEAKKQKLVFAKNQTPINAPHFVMFVRQTLVEKYGEEMVAQGGLSVTTTLDLDIQKMAEEVVKKEVDAAKRYRVGNGAAVVLAPQTGEILAMVGSKDYFDMKADGNVNVVTSHRSPGSSIKVVNYAYALSHGYSPASILQDTPVRFVVPGQPPYVPKNYDNNFRGSITLRSALAESRNIPAVRLLAANGLQNIIEMGREMGITTWEDPSKYGLSLTLGGGDVRLLDLAQVYATVANMGARPTINYISKVVNYRGEVLEHPSAGQERVLDPRVAFMLIDILKDNNARSPSFGSHSALVIPGRNDVAVKTGTSNDLRDNLTVGFNQKYLTAVWVGNNDYTPMGRIASGITGAAPIWNGIMRRLLAGEPAAAWQVPEGLVLGRVCENGRQDWYLAEKKPMVRCNPIKPNVAGDDLREGGVGQILPQTVVIQ